MLAPRTDAATPSARWDSVFLTVVACGMIASDCYSLFGGWVVNIKYVVLAVVAVFILARLTRTRIAQSQILLVIGGLTLLVVEILLQQTSYSRIRAVGLFLMVALVSVGSPVVVRSYRSLYNCGIACTAFIAFLLLAVLPDCINQFNLYVNIGRPRLKGCFSNPNSLGHIAAMVFVIVVIARMRFASSGREKLISTACVVLCVVYLVLSGSRTAQACAAAFVLALLFYAVEKRIPSKGGVVLARLLIGAIILVVVYLSYQSIVTSYLLTGRALSWSNFGSYESFFGYGYVSSAGISYITAVANGHVEMLWISLYYRVGLVGILAYALIFVSMLKVGPGRGIVFYPLLVAVFVQTLGESYLSSVLSFPSLFDWLLVGGVAHLESSIAAKEAVEVVRDAA